MVRAHLAAFALLLLVSPARAARPHAAVSLTYLPGEQRAACPSEDFFRMELASRFGYDPFEEPSPRRHLTVKIARVRGKFEVSGEIADDPEGKVSFRYQAPASLSCKQAVAVMGLAVAAELTTAPAAEPSAPPVVIVVEAPRADAAPTPPAAQRDAPTPPAAPLPRTRVQIGAGSFVALNSAPSPTAGFLVSLGLRFPTRPALSVALEGHALVPRSTDVTGEAGVPAEVRATLFSATGVPCVHLASFLGCGLVELGQYRVGVSDTLQATTEASCLYVAAGLRAGVELPLTAHFSLRGYGDLLGARLPRLVVQQRPVWSPVPLTGALALAATASF